MASRAPKKKPRHKSETIVVWTRINRTTHQKIKKESTERGRPMSIVLMDKLEEIYGA